MSSSKGYQFSISGNTVTAVYEVKNGRMKAERMDSDESWSFDGTHVIKSEMDDGRLEITTYADVDKDGLFFETGKTYSASGSPSWGGAGAAPVSPGAGSGEKGLRFDIDSSGVVKGISKVGNGRVKSKEMDWDEVWSFDGRGVTKTETKHGKKEMSVYTDDNNDGVFQKIYEVKVMTGSGTRSPERHDSGRAGGRDDRDDWGDGGAADLGRPGLKLGLVGVSDAAGLSPVDFPFA